MAGLRKAAWLLAASSLMSANQVLAATPTRLGGRGGVDIPVGRILAATVLCIMLAALVALALRRGGGTFKWNASSWPGRLPTHRRVQIIETRRASQYADVCLLRCDGRDYLALCSQHQFLLLRESEAAPAEDVSCD